MGQAAAYNASKAPDTQLPPPDTCVCVNERRVCDKLQHLLHQVTKRKQHRHQPDALTSLRSLVLCVPWRALARCHLTTSFRMSMRTAVHSNTAQCGQQ
jgi:hypothetical protein